MKTIRNLILSLILPLALVVPELARAAVTCPICGIPIETTSHRCSPGNVGGGGDQKARQRQAEIDTVGTMQREFRRIELDTQERIRRQNAEAEAEAARERALQNQRDDSPPRQRDDSPPRQREDFGSRGSDPGSRRSDPVNYTPDYDRGTERPVSRATAPKPVAARPLFSEPLSSFLPTDRGGKTGAAAPARSQTSDWRSASLDPQPQSTISSLLDQITPPQDSHADYDKLVALCRESLAEAGRFRTGREDLLANAKWAGGQFEQGKSDATLAQVGDAAQVTKGLTDVILVAAPEAKIFKVIAAAGVKGL